MNDNLKTGSELFKSILIDIHKSAYNMDYITKDAIMVEELLDFGFRYSHDWLADTEFFQTFKGNMVGYYLGICVNCLCGGMAAADAWADGGDRLSEMKYDEIYDGGVWNNVFVLIEMTDDNEKKDFQNFVISLYEKWVVEMKDYFKAPGANDYISKTLAAFFQLGVTMRLDILGY